MLYTVSFKEEKEVTINSMWRVRTESIGKIEELTEKNDILELEHWVYEFDTC